MSPERNSRASNRGARTSLRLFVGGVAAIACAHAACSEDPVDPTAPTAAQDASSETSTKDASSGSDATTASDSTSGTDTGTEASTDAGVDAGRFQLHAGSYYACLDGDQGVKCWGSNVQGQLLRFPKGGSFNPDPQATTPPMAPSLLGLGGDHACAAGVGDAAATCWGSNVQGELGHDQGNPDASLGPVVGLPGPVTSLGLGRWTSCAIANGQTYCWGDPLAGGLGAAVDGAAWFPPGVVVLDAGAETVRMGINFGCVLEPAGTVSCWGSNRQGQLGFAFDALAHPMPVRIAGLSGVEQIATNYTTVCALLSDKTVTCWGGNQGWSDNTLGGVLGHSPLTDPVCGFGRCNATPTTVNGLSNVRSVGVGIGHACAVKDDDTLWCWGSNERGQLGHDPSADIDGGASQPYTFTPSQVLGLPAIDHVALGASFTCAATKAREVYCWGRNFMGILGTDGGDTATPTKVNGL